MSLTHLFRSTDPGAPGNLTFPGVGSLTAVLDAVLVNGYNTKSVTLTRSGTTVTATSVGHGFNERQVISIRDADQAEYNQDKTRITVVDADTFTYEITGTPASPATGTITARVAPLGWSVAYTDSAAQRSYERPAASKGFFLNVDDSLEYDPWARLRLFETTTTYGCADSAGTNPTPSEAQCAGGLHLFKGNPSAEWVVIGTESALYFFSTSGGAFATAGLAAGFLVFDATRAGAGDFEVIFKAAHVPSPEWFRDGGIVQDTYYMTSDLQEVAYALRAPGTAASTRCCIAGTGSNKGSNPLGTTAMLDYDEEGLCATPMHVYTLTGRRVTQVPGLLASLVGTVFDPLDTFSTPAWSPVGAKDWLVVGGSGAFRIFVCLSDDWEDV